jgi:hypothetical protein
MGADVGAHRKAIGSWNRNPQASDNGRETSIFEIAPSLRKALGWETWHAFVKIETQAADAGRCGPTYPASRRAKTRTKHQAHAREPGLSYCVAAERARCVSFEKATTVCKPRGV